MIIILNKFSFKFGFALFIFIIITQCVGDFCPAARKFFDSMIGFGPLANRACECILYMSINSFSEYNRRQSKGGSALYVFFKNFFLTECVRLRKKLISFRAEFESALHYGLGRVEMLFSIPIPIPLCMISFFFFCEAKWFFRGIYLSSKQKMRRGWPEDRTLQYCREIWVRQKLFFFSTVCNNNSLSISFLCNSLH